jgi:hypothetical protein
MQIGSSKEFEELLQKSNRIYIPIFRFKRIFEYVFEYSALVIVYRLYIRIFQKGVRIFPKYSNISKEVFEYSEKGIRIFINQKKNG